MSIKNLHSLKIWNLANDLTDSIYEVSQKFPPEEKFALSSQIRRSVSSVSSNISEGHSRIYKKEFIRFMHIAKGSLAETYNHLFTAKRQNFIHASIYKEIYDDIRQLEAMIIGCIKSLEK